LRKADKGLARLWVEVVSVNKPDHRHRRLLRARRERPRGCRAGEERNEVAPSQLIELHEVPRSQKRMA